MNPCPPPGRVASRLQEGQGCGPAPGYRGHRWLWASRCTNRGVVWQCPEWSLSTRPTHRLPRLCLAQHRFPSLCLRFFTYTPAMGIVPSFLSLLRGLNEKIHLTCLAKCLTYNKPLVCLVFFFNKYYYY